MEAIQLQQEEKLKPATELDLGDIVDILESFVKKLPAMELKDQIDLAARLKPAVKHIEKIDETVKAAVKVKLKHKEGELKGDLFKAILKLIPIDRFQQKLFKEAKPAEYAKYVREDTDERVSFELR